MLGAIGAAAVFAAAVGAAAAIGALTASSSAEQYAVLRRPSWSPPSWLFGPVWTVLYVLIAIAGWRAWYVSARRGSEQRRWLPWYAVNLVLNALWPPLFFGAGARKVALGEIVLLDLVTAATVVVLWRIDRPAALLLLPYLIWTVFATALNGAIVALD